ncbi:MAG: hypothetical protein QM756_09555 [Polyangiaceae bacterium]
MGTIVDVNSENWPVNIISVKSPSGQALDRAAAGLVCTALLALTERKQRYANIVDLTECGSVSGSERAFIGDDFNEHIEVYRSYVIAVTVVLRSQVLRGVLTAIGWVHPYPFPLKFVNTLEAGARELKLILSQQGISWPGLRPLALQPPLVASR